MGLGFQCHYGEGASSKEGVKGLPTFKLLLNFDCKSAHIFKGKIRLKIYLVGNIGG